MAPGPTDERHTSHCARPRLLEAIDAGLASRRLVLVHAAAGAGKSVLLDQWLAHGRQRRPDECVARVSHGCGEADLRALTEGGSGPDTVLVIDDVEHLDASVLRLLDRVLTDGSNRCRMVLAGRTRPALSLARLALDGQVAFLGTADLALRIDELTEVVTPLNGAPPDPDVCLKLLDETEGWLAGVKQVASSQLVDGSAGHLDRLGTLRPVSDYVTEQVLHRLPDDLRRFMLATCVIDRLEADLCDAITGSTDGQRMLEELERLELFLVPLDDRRGAYRYHRMVRDVLRHRFRTDDRQGWCDAHLRAAEKYFEVGRLQRGIACLVEAEAWAEVVQAVTAHQYELVGAGGGRAAARWLEAVPRDVLAEDPRAAMVLATLHRLNGDVAKAEAVVASLGHDAYDGAGDPELHARMAAAWKACGLAWGTPPEEALDAAVALEQVVASAEGRRQRSGNLPKYRHYRTQLVRYRTAASEALLYLMRVDEAAVWAERSVDAAELDPTLRATALGTQAYLDARCGNLVAAAAAAEEARDLNGNPSAGQHSVAMPPEFALIEVAYATDDLDRADKLLAGVDEQVRSMNASTRVAQVALSRAAVTLGRGRFRDAIAVLAEHRRERWPALPTGLEVRFTSVDACLRIFMGDVGDGRRKLRSSGLSLSSSPGAFLTLAAVERDRASMRFIIDSWPESATLRMKAQYLVARALLADIDDDPQDRRRHLEALATLVVPERFIRPVVDLAPAVGPMIVEAAAMSASSDLLALGDLAAAATRAGGRRPAGRPVRRLSVRESEVLKLLTTDLTNPEIAAALDISPNTLKTYLRRLYQKLGVSARRDAVRRAADLGLR